MATSEIEKEFQTLKDDITKLRADMGSLVGSVSDEAKSRANVTGIRVKDQVNQSKQKITNKVNDASTQAKQQFDDNPLLFLLTSFVVGILLGRLFTSSK